MKAAEPRTVLMLSYAFPPEAYVGGRRSLKYCKFLGEFGWRPVVITINPRPDAFQDARLCEQLPADVEVMRTRDLDAMPWVMNLAARWRRLAGRPGGEAAPAAAPMNTPVAAEAAPAAGVLGRTKDAVLRLLLETPDSHVWWVPMAFARGLRVLLTRKVDVIYSSSPPHSSHFAGYLLAKIFRKPHVVDFRDPWVVETPPSGLRQRLLARAKRAIVANAAKVVLVSPGEPEELHAEYPRLDMRRVAVLTNGFDPDDFVFKADVEKDAAHVTLTHAGTIYPETGREVFHAVERLIQVNPGIRRLLRVNLIGDIDERHRDIIGRLEAEGVVRTFGMQSHQATLERVRQSDILLLLQRDGTSAASHIPAKVFEYLYFGKPILAIVKPGTLSDLLATTGLGVVVPPGDQAGLAQAIETLCARVRAGAAGMTPNAESISRFERRNLTAGLAGLLEEVARGN